MSIAPSMGISRSSAPRFPAMVRASAWVSSLEWGEGITTQVNPGADFSIQHLAGEGSGGGRCRRGVELAQLQFRPVRQRRAEAGFQANRRERAGRQSHRDVHLQVLGAIGKDIPAVRSSIAQDEQFELFALLVRPNDGIRQLGRCERAACAHNVLRGKQ